MKELYAALENLVWVTQLGTSLLFPLVFFLWLAHRMVSLHGWPYWVYIPAVLLGILTGVQTFRKFAQRMMKQAKKDLEEKKPVGFNKH